MSVLKVSNYLLGKMDYLSRIKSDNSSTRRKTGSA